VQLPISDQQQPRPYLAPQYIRDRRMMDDNRDKRPTFKLTA